MSDNMEHTKEVEMLHGSGIVVIEGEFYMMCGEDFIPIKVIRADKTEITAVVKRFPRKLPKGVTREPVI